MKHFLIVVCCVLFPSIVMGQRTSSLQRPAWVDGYFAEEANSYVEVTSATGYSEEDARNKAAQIVIERRSLATGQRVNVQVQNGNIIVTGNDNLTVKSRVIDEYREHLESGVYRVSLLVQTAKNPEFQYERVNVTDRYPFSARTFIPGMAQLHKGSTGKGIAFIVGEVAAIGGIVAFEGLRASNESKINSTHNAADRQKYIDNASTMQNVRNGFIAGAAAIYVWNIIDGAVAKGKKHVVILGDAQMRFSPYATNQSAGMMVSLNF
jgi:hypothetical protein